MSAEPIIKAESVVRDFTTGGLLGRRRPTFRAVSDFDIEIADGERIALVGESGSGKTTLGRMLLSLIRPTAGRIFYRGVGLDQLTPELHRRYRRSCQMVFQDPQSSLNPARRIGPVLAEVVKRHQSASRTTAADRVSELLGRVGLGPESFHAYPHNLSGGQRQRVGIARALAAEPELIVADEPVSSLDVSLRGGIMRLLLESAEDRRVAFLLITHDLQTAKKFAQRVMVMFRGVILESGPTAEVLGRPLHPYTRSLLSAVPRARPGVLPVAADWLGPDPRTRLDTYQGFTGNIPALAEVGPGHFLRRFPTGVDFGLQPPRAD
jgi:ABC-type oligopeptide transport system ATPase subunit